MKDTKTLALLLAALKKEGITELPCPTCAGEGGLYRQLNDGDLVPAERCPNCDGAGLLRMEDM
jgi:DnaJ-class molecular chaperone